MCLRSGNTAGRYSGFFAGLFRDQFRTALASWGGRGAAGAEVERRYLKNKKVDVFGTQCIISKFELGY